MINFLTESEQQSEMMGDVFSFVGGITSFFPIIFIIFGIFFAAILAFVVVVFVKNIKAGKKPHVFKYQGHEIQVLISMTRIEIFYDGKIVDEIALSSNTAGAKFNEILDGVHYKINIGYSGITPSVVVFADNEKLAPVK